MQWTIPTGEQQTKSLSRAQIVRALTYRLPIEPISAGCSTEFETAGGMR
jgi:hypothetical protein